MSFWNFAGNILGALVGSRSQDRATDAAVSGQQNYVDLLREMFNYTQGVNAPMIGARDDAVSEIMALLGMGPTQYDYSTYLADNPSIQGNYDNMTPEKRRWLMRRGADTNNDGQISPEEFAEHNWQWRQERGQTEGVTAPTAISQASMMDGLMRDPAWQYVLKQRRDDLDASAAAMGLTNSGWKQRANSELASQNALDVLGFRLNQLFGLAQGGQTAANNAQTAAGNFGNQAGGAMANMGLLRGSSYANQGNMWGNALGSGAEAFGEWWNRRNNRGG